MVALSMIPLDLGYPFKQIEGWSGIPASTTIYSNLQLVGIN